MRSQQSTSVVEMQRDLPGNTIDARRNYTRQPVMREKLNGQLSAHW
jgi:hypothetical protein